MSDDPLRAWKARPFKPPLRWFQFSLRSLLVFTVICAIPFAWLGYKIQQKRAEESAAAQIVKSGGTVQYDFEAIIGAQPPGPAWLRVLLGQNFFSHVEHVVRIGQWFDDSGLEWIEHFPELGTLTLSKNRITDNGLMHLQALTQLASLDLDETPVSDAGVKRLTVLRELRSLDLGGTKISNAGFEPLIALTHLQSLDLEKTAVDDGGIIYLKQMHHLKFLDLRGTKLSDTGLSDIQNALSPCQVFH